MEFPSDCAPDVAVVPAPSDVVSGVVVALVSKRYEYPATPEPPVSVAAVQLTSMVLSVLQVDTA